MQKKEQVITLDQKKIIDQALVDEAHKRMLHYKPYPKQKDFHNAGYYYRERTLSAGNQVGKTTASCIETAYHLVGIYPPWWGGAEFTGAVNWWMGGESSDAVRDSLQRKLLGEVKHGFRDGLLHRSYIEDYSSKRGVADCIDTVWIKNAAGGTSSLTFKSYEQGRKKWQAATLHGVTLDEEPPEDIFMEAKSRTNATEGLVMLAFTPLKGMSNVVYSFWKNPTDDQNLTLMGLDDAAHFSEDQKKKIIASYPEHERKARTQGIPSMGSGRIFPLARESYECDMPEIKPWWPRLCGMDIGWDHPTTFVWIAWDRDTDTIYVYDCYKKSEAPIPIHASAAKQRGGWIPVAWPHDGLQHDKSSGEQIAELYRQEGVNMLPEKASFVEGGNGVEAGLAMMLNRFQNGTLRISRHLEELFLEIELYHRDNGRVVKEKDDLISALRYAIMMIRCSCLDPDFDREIEERESSFFSQGDIGIGGY